MNSPEESMPNKWAILIGVNFYIRADPDMVKCARSCVYGNLKGCVPDIENIERYLLDVQKIHPHRIRKYTATQAKGKDFPEEPEEQWPTYETITAALIDVTEKANAGDLVYFHYSGHGGRMKSMFPDLKSNGYDEGLAPTDINRGGRYVRDFELAYLLGQMVEKGLVLSVIIDSCHSGGAVRDPTEAAPRSPGKVDKSLLSTDVTIFPEGDLRRNWKHQQERACRSRPATLLEPSGYEFIAACRANESARERCFGPEMCAAGERRGVLTHWLLQALDSIKQEGEASARQDVSYRMLYRKVYGDIYDGKEEQTPVFVGDGERIFLGVGRIRDTPTIPVKGIHKSTNTVMLMAGKAHGVTPASEYAVYKWNDPDTIDPVNAYKRLIVIDVADMLSTAFIIGGDVKHWPSGCQAVLLRQDHSSVYKRVKLLGAIPGIDWDRYRGAIVPLVEAGSQPPDYQISTVTADSGYEVLYSDGKRVPNIPVSPNAELAFRRIVHVARYMSLRAIQNEIDEEESDTEEVFIFRQVQRKMLNDTEEELEYEFRNNSGYTINIVVMHFTPKWGVRQVFPVQTDLDSIDEDDFRTFSIIRDKPLIDPPHNTDVVKAFVTYGSTSFRTLEMPEIGTEDTITSSGTTFIAPTSQFTIPMVSSRRQIVEPSTFNMWDTFDLSIT